ncbi:acetyl-CoA carboxylase biotin carboxylase subunit [Pasteuria penetrans]|uniref:acetyl-CoA carboxylase biotin carboxylase subunit n=1 Tax=Pasteuria penetrans TaxID=86005 RepID=UPI000FB54D96|nr:acetyl-CoA carboxylase biotin carboxylase subunit [Pasteuria penetrans]
MQKVLVANRGEIAVRILRTCREMGLATVAVYSEADRDALHVTLADEAYCIGPAAAVASYLNMTNLMSVATLVGADAIHPGYGFLAENADFAELCNACGISFIGPSPEAISTMGDKQKAREIVVRADVPVLPGGILEGSAEEMQASADAVGYPLLVKAIAGGGGRGMRAVEHPGELLRVIQIAQQEARNCFGSSEVYLEKLLCRPRHIEIQIFSDRYGNIIHLGERECSIQRRYQKLIEEAPSPVLTAALRESMGQAALRAARSIDYVGAGTVEFLLAPDGNFYFMEMNTRIQVEHPVTEMITGLDLVQLQLLVSRGERLPIRQEDVLLSGCAVECRINAEDPEHDFRPSSGTIDFYLPPGGVGVRVDSACYPGCRISPFYDSLLAKVITWGSDRREACKRMERALREFAVEGISTTIPFHLRLLAEPRFSAGDIHVQFLQEEGGVQHGRERT